MYASQTKLMFALSVFVIGCVYRRACELIFCSQQVKHNVKERWNNYLGLFPQNHWGTHKRKFELLGITGSFLGQRPHRTSQQPWAQRSYDTTSRCQGVSNINTIKMVFDWYHLTAPLERIQLYILSVTWFYSWIISQNFLDPLQKSPYKNHFRVHQKMRTYHLDVIYFHICPRIFIHENKKSYSQKNTHQTYMYYIVT